jgi:hypothetical protein
VSDVISIFPLTIAIDNDVFVASWVTTLRRFGTTCMYASSIDAYHIGMSLDCCRCMKNDDDKCVMNTYTCDNWNCFVNVYMEVNCSC